MAKVEWTVLVDEDIPVKCAACAAHDEVTEGKVVEDMIRGYHYVVEREKQGRPLGIGLNTRTGAAGFVEMHGRPTYPQEPSVAAEFGLKNHLTAARSEQKEEAVDAHWEKVEESEDGV